MAESNSDEEDFHVYDYNKRRPNRRGQKEKSTTIPAMKGIASQYSYKQLAIAMYSQLYATIATVFATGACEVESVANPACMGVGKF